MYKINLFLKKIYRWLSNIESDKKLTYFGWGIIVIAPITPFTIIYIYNKGLNFNIYNSLGPIGDFFGGTTVGLLSLASTLFILATLSIQRKEMKTNQLNADDTKKALLKQQFETTLSNMINQHIVLVNNLKLLDTDITGKSVLNKFHSLVEERYMKEEYESYFRDYIYCDYNITEPMPLYELHKKTKQIIYEEPLSFEKFADLLTIENLESEIVSFSDLFISCEEIIGIDPNFQENNEIVDTFDNIFYPEEMFKKLSYNFTKINTGYVLDNFFENFINIMEFIEESNFEGKQKSNYIKMFISQLSAYEIFMLKMESVLGDNEEIGERFKRYEILSKRLQAMMGIILWNTRGDVMHFNSKRESLVKL